MADAKQEGAEPVRQGWFRSPAGVLSYADGPSQVAAFTARGYSKVDDEKAAAEVGDGIRLRVRHADTRGTFEDVRAAVRDESPRSAGKRAAVEREKRSAAARKGAETKRRNAEKAATEPKD